MNLKRQSTVLLGGNMKIKIILKYLYVLCFVFCFFAPQLFASFNATYCKQRKENLNKEYINNIRRVDEKYGDKVQEIILNRKEKGQHLCCKTCNHDSICCEFSKEEFDELEKLKSLRNLFDTLNKQELEDINWACKNHE
jgi:hypothetical protein